MRFIVKPVAELDEYVEWSTIVDAPTAIDSRAQMERILDPGLRGSALRFDRADRTGSSAAGEVEGWFGWDDTEFHLGNMHWQSPESRMVRRENLAAYTRADLAGDTAACIRLTEIVPEEDDTDDPREDSHTGRTGATRAQDGQGEPEGANGAQIAAHGLGYPVSALDRINAIAGSVVYAAGGLLPPGPCGNYVSDLHLAGPCVRESGHGGDHDDGAQSTWQRGETR